MQGKIGPYYDNITISYYIIISSTNSVHLAIIMMIVLLLHHSLNNYYQYVESISFTFSSNSKAFSTETSGNLIEICYTLLYICNE